MFQKLGSLNSEPALPSTSYLPATPSVVPASSYIPSSETPAGQLPTWRCPPWTCSPMHPGVSGHLCHVLPEPLLVLTGGRRPFWSHKFPGMNPEFLPALSILGANKQCPLRTAQQECILQGWGGVSG